eukprot:scaffold128798_cov40-Tisochrysis_lutea.AAC.1
MVEGSPLTAAPASAAWSTACHTGANCSKEAAYAGGSAAWMWCRCCASLRGLQIWRAARHARAGRWRASGRRRPAARIARRVVRGEVVREGGREGRVK